MKKIILSLFLINLSCSAFSISTAINFSAFQQLIELNKYWESQNLSCDVERLPYSEKELIQLHLKMVNKVLRNKNISHLNNQQKQNRSNLLLELKKYEQKGTFPINTYHLDRTPYFIDDAGTACAVGQLIVKSGSKHLAESISEQFNYFYLEDMPQEELKNWAAAQGFTIEELKWIQPAYGPQCQPGQVIHPTCSSGLLANGCFNPDWQADSLIQPIRFFTEYDYGNGWVPDSMNLWQFQGAAPGSYRVTITDTTGRSKLYNYTIVAPPAIASNDSVVAHSTSQTACNGRLSVTPSNGVGPYQISLMNQALLFSKTSATGVFDSLCPAVYTIVIYDANFCQTVDSANILFTSGIQEFNPTVYIKFQNPIPSNSLQLSTNLSGSKQFRLYSSTGKLVREQTFNLNKFTTELEFESGLYILQISNGKQVIQKKVIISN